MFEKQLVEKRNFDNVITIILYLKEINLNQINVQNASNRLIKIFFEKSSRIHQLKLGVDIRNIAE